MSSRKFSYWSSPQITTKSGANSSRTRRALRNPDISASRCRRAADSPWSAPYSSRIAAGQPSGWRYCSGSAGSSRMRFRMRPMLSSVPESGGKWVTPRPRISPMSNPPKAREARSLGVRLRGYFVKVRHAARPGDSPPANVEFTSAKDKDRGFRPMSPRRCKNRLGCGKNAPGVRGPKGICDGRSSL